MPTLMEYQKAFRSNPNAFLEGAGQLCKEAARASRYSYGDDDEESLWDKLRPWLVALGVGYGGLRLGAAWGRHQAGNGNPNGPVVGPIQEALLRLGNPGKKPYWTTSEDGRAISEMRDANGGGQ